MGTTNIEDRISSLEREISEIRGMVQALLAISGSGGGIAMKAEGTESIVEFKDLVPYTPKQHAVLQMIVKGVSTAGMAEALCVTESTVKVHLRSIMQKKDVRTRAGLAMWYSDVMKICDEETYKHRAGLPKDWYENRMDYPDITKILQTKTK